MAVYVFQGHHIPITQELESAFRNFDAHRSIPAAIAARVDPTGAALSHAANEFYDAVYDAWDDYLTQNVTVEEYDELCDTIMNDYDQIYEQFEQLFITV